MFAAIKYAITCWNHTNMATLRINALHNCPAVLNIVKLLRNGGCDRSLDMLFCSRNFSTYINPLLYTRKGKPDSLTKPDDWSSRKTSSVFAELFADDQSISDSSAHKTNRNDHLSVKELDELENLLNRRLSMKVNNTVLSTGEVYNPVDELDKDECETSTFGETDDFIEEIKGTANDSKQKQSPSLRQHDAYVYGTADPSVPLSESPCAGCGALLHCQDPGIPGFVPSQIFLETSDEKMKRTICKRCYILAKHKVALDVSASPEEYIRVLEEIKHKRALILLVLDLMDIPNSIFQHFPDIVGKQRPLYVIGNKVDLLPKDSTGYLQRTKDMIGTYMEEYGLNRSNQIRHVALVSAKTGYGIEELVTKLLVDWGRKGDVYVVGCTNVGKSTLFNALLSSDYCRSLSRDFILRATISNWPGTTLNTLKFPVINPSPWKLARRGERLLKERNSEVEEQRLKQQKIAKAKRISIHDSTLRGTVGQTFFSAKEVALEEASGSIWNIGEVTYSSGALDGNIKKSQSDKASLMNAKIKRIMDQYDAESMQASRYCYDTPGVVNPEQIINLLNEKELTVVLAKRLVMPRTFVMSPLDTMFVTGLGRLDYLEGKRTAYFTVICSTSLPVHIIKTEEAEDFYTQNLGTKELGVPLGDGDRLSRLPPLEGKEFKVTCIGWLQSAADIILSSVGWVSVTGNHNMEVKVKAYTPAGRGCVLRSPSLLEHAVNLKGRRIKGTKAYHPKLKKI